VQPMWNCANHPLSEAFHFDILVFLLALAPFHYSKASFLWTSPSVFEYNNFI
jgi:hypothetical protein